MKRQPRMIEPRVPLGRNLGAICFWLVLVFLALPRALFAVPGADPDTGQARGIEVTSPEPGTVLRVSRDFVPITFTTCGATGTYHISTVGADLEGSTFDPGPDLSDGMVIAGFNDPNNPIKTVGVSIFQSLVNAELVTEGGNVASIHYDKLPPNFNIQRVVKSMDQLPEPFAQGETIVTSNPELILEGTVQDPNNGATGPQIKIINSVDGAAEVSQDAMDDNSFQSTITLGAPGTKQVRFAVEDSFDDPALDLPNRSEPLFITVILDQTAPVVEDVRIIRPDGAGQVNLEAGPQTFVGRDPITIRVTFSEPVRVSPTLAVTQNGMQTIPASLATVSDEPRATWEWTYTPLPQETLNGPATIALSALDVAGNVLDPIPESVVPPEGAFTVDTVSPSRVRFPGGAGPGEIVSVPRDGSVVGKDGFPTRLQAIVEDYDTSDLTLDTTVNASGLDFRRIRRGTADPANPERSLFVRLVSPSGDEVPGQPSVAPPNGIFFDLPPRDGSVSPLPGFREDRDEDGILDPDEGDWSFQVDLVDRVGNTRTETFRFRVDTNPIPISSLVVTFDDGTNSANPSPLMVGVESCYGGNGVRDTTIAPSIQVSSTDPSFVATRTSVRFFSRVGGENAQPQLFDGMQTSDMDTNTVTLTDLRVQGQALDSDIFPVPGGGTTPNIPGTFLDPGEEVPVLDPRLGRSDGIHLIRVNPADIAGNRGVSDPTAGNGGTREFAEYEVNVDTVTPYTRHTFPDGDSSINEPLRFVDAVIVDPAAPNGNAGCGVDVNLSSLQWSFIAPYRDDEVDRTLLDANNNLRTVLRFIHMPNSTDPTMESFNPVDDAFRVLLELIDNRGQVRTLPRDGSMDGVYTIRSVPVDRAGNSMGDGTAPFGDYFGMAADSQTTHNRIEFSFLYDTIDPALELIDFPDNGVISGTTISMMGTVQDLSAQKAAPNMGGSGVDKVEVKLEVIDENGNPIESVPPMVTPTGGVVPGRSNPVIPATTATISPLADPANDPERGFDANSRQFQDQERFMNAGFASTLRELREWNIRLQLPPEEELLQPDATQNQSFQLTVTAFDRAGNTTVIRRAIERVTTETLPPPTLRSPECQTFTNSLPQAFEWRPVSGASNYVFQITEPSGRVVERTTPLTEVRFNLTAAGTYSWRVATVDAAETRGEFSDPCQLTLDRTRPKVLTFAHQDPVEPNSNRGVLNIGKVKFTLTFDEELDPNRGVVVLVDPQGAVGVPAIEVTTTSQSNHVWTGEMTIPANANPQVWDGMATVTVQGGTDLAGNEMRIDAVRTLEIDTGPFFTTRFFVSPFQEREITVAILSSEDLHEPPTLSQIAGAALINFDQTGERPRANAISGDKRSSFVTLRVPNSRVDEVAFDLTGQDVELNSSKRRVSFAVVIPTQQAQSLVARSGLQIQAPASKSEAPAPIYFFPPVRALGSEEELAALQRALAEEAPGALRQAELRASRFLDSVVTARAEGAPLRVRVPAEMQGEVQGPKGLFVLDGNRWVFAGRTGEDGTIDADLPAYGPLMVASDAVPPQVEMTSHEAGGVLTEDADEVVYKVQDLGCGLSPEGVRAYVDGVEAPVEFDSVTGEVRLKDLRSLPPGQHEFVLEVSDQLGNTTRTQPQALTTASGYGFLDSPLPVPNPARVSTRLRFDLTHPAQTQSVDFEIFDTAGRRLRTLRATGPFATRNNQILWDLRTNRGRVVRNGVYLFKATVRGALGRARATGKIAVIR